MSKELLRNTVGDHVLEVAHSGLVLLLDLVQVRLEFVLDPTSHSEHRLVLISFSVSADATHDCPVMLLKLSFNTTNSVVVDRGQRLLELLPCRVGFEPDKGKPLLLISRL